MAAIKPTRQARALNGNGTGNTAVHGAIPNQLSHKSLTEIGCFNAFYFKEDSIPFGSECDYISVIMSIHFKSETLRKWILFQRYIYKYLNLNAFMYIHTYVEIIQIQIENQSI